MSAAKALAHAPVEITIIDRHNYHLFQPLLYQVATASLSPAEIAQPIRSIVRDQTNARVLLDEVTGVDARGKTVRTAGGHSVPYDHLIIATGARHSYFGNDHWEAFAPGIKTVDDATRVRAKILLAFERAEGETDKAKRDALLTFVIVGGGPTGVEMAGAIAELARKLDHHRLPLDHAALFAHHVGRGGTAVVAEFSRVRCLRRRSARSRRWASRCAWRAGDRHLGRPGRRRNDADPSQDRDLGGRRARLGCGRMAEGALRSRGPRDRERRLLGAGASTRCS